MKATSKSSQEFNGSTVRFDPVDAFVNSGLQQRFLSVFNTKTVWTTSTDKVKAVDKLFPEGKERISYPYAFLIPSSWTKSRERASLRSTSMRGTRVSVATNNRTTLKVRIMPIDFSVTVEWTSNSFEDLQDIARRWLFIQERGSLNFQIEYGQTAFDISTVPDDTVTFPMREADPDNVQEYLMTTNLLVRGWISEPEAIEEQVIEQLEVSGVLTGDASTEGTFMRFRTPLPR